MERQVYQRRSFIPKVCIECKKEFQAQRNTAMYCGAGCLQAHRKKRLAGHQETMKMTRATPVVNYPGQQQFQKATEEQYIEYIKQLEQHINNMTFIIEDKLKTREEHYEKILKQREEQYEKIIERYESRVNELIKQLDETRKENRAIEFIGKVFTGK